MNKKYLIIAGVVVLLLIGGLFFVLTSKRTSPTQISNDGQTEILTLSPDSVGLQLIPSSNNQKIKVIVGKVSDIKSLEYDISYDADIPASELAPGEEGGKVERGFNDQATISPNATKYESKAFDLGSCSRNVCRYDTGVEEVNIEMKVIKRDGKIYMVKDSVKL